MLRRRDFAEKSCLLLRRVAASKLAPMAAAATSIPLLRSMSSAPKHHNTEFRHVPNTMTKKMLVWSGQFASAAEIPETITSGQLGKARGWFRIRLGNFLMIITLVGCYFMAKLSKRDAARGQSITRQNLEWHESMGKGKLEGRSVDEALNERDDK